MYWTHSSVYGCQVLPFHLILRSNVSLSLHRKSGNSCGNVECPIHDAHSLRQLNWKFNCKFVLGPVVGLVFLTLCFRFSTFNLLQFIIIPHSHKLAHKPAHTHSAIEWKEFFFLKRREKQKKKQRIGMALHFTFEMTVDICQIRLTIENWPARSGNPTEPTKPNCVHFYWSFTCLSVCAI